MSCETFFVSASGLLQSIARIGFQKLWADHGQHTLLGPEGHIATGTDRQAFQVFPVRAEGFQQRKIPSRPKFHIDFVAAGGQPLTIDGPCDLKGLSLVGLKHACLFAVA